VDVLLGLAWLDGAAQAFAELDPADLIFFAAITALGMFVYAFAGFGSGLLCIPLLALRLEAETFVPAFLLCMFLINARLVYKARGHVQWAHVSWLLAGAALAAPLGVYLLKVVSTGTISVVVGALAISLGLMYLVGIKVPIGSDRLTRLGLGGVSGMLAGMSSAGGPPVVIYALAREWPKDRFRGSLMAYFLCLAVFVIAMYVVGGYFTAEAMGYAASGFVPMVLAAVLGSWLKTRTDEKRFRTLVLWLLILVGVIGVGNSLFLIVNGEW